MKMKTEENLHCAHKCVSMCKCSCGCAPHDIYLCILSKSNLPCCYPVLTNRHCCLKYCRNTTYSITQCQSSRWIMSARHLDVILLKECHIELNRNPIMAAIRQQRMHNSIIQHWWLTITCIHWSMFVQIAKCMGKYTNRHEKKLIHAQK